MAPLPLFEALSAIAVSSTHPSWTRRFGWKHRACQRTAAKRSSSYLDTWLHDIRKIPGLALPHLRANRRAMPKNHATGKTPRERNTPRPEDQRAQDSRIRFFAIQA